MLARKSFLTVAATALAAPMLGAGSAAGAQFTALERHAGGRLGVYALDAGSGQLIAHRANERFPMCSTFKLLAVGAVLARVDARNEDLNRRVGYGDADILAYAPVTKAHLEIGSMTIGELCAAAIEWSDNTAANLLLHSLLGPAGVTKFARSLNDPITRLDRNEPTLNTAIRATCATRQRPRQWPRYDRAPARHTLVTADARTPENVAARLQDRRVTKQLRWGLPASWRIGAKTGSGAHGRQATRLPSCWPTGRAETKPILLPHTSPALSRRARGKARTACGRSPALSPATCPPK